MKTQNKLAKGSTGVTPQGNSPKRDQQVPEAPSTYTGLDKLKVPPPWYNQQGGRLSRELACQSIGEILPPKPRPNRGTDTHTKSMGLLTPYPRL